MYKKILLWCAVVFMSIQIFGFSSKTAAESSGTSEKIAHGVVKTINKLVEIENEQKEEVFHVVHFTIRKLAHFAEYAMLSALTFFLAKSYGLKNSMCAIISLGYCFIFATSDEIHQLYVDGRSGEIRDVFIDFCGGVFANLCIALGIKIKSKLSTKNKKFYF